MWISGCPPASLASWTCGLPCQKVPTPPGRRVAVNESARTLAVTARVSADECVVVFRGSKNIYNVLEDLGKGGFGAVSKV